MSKFIDLTKHKFGRLTVIARGENSKQKKAGWICECVCGNSVLVRATSLPSGDTRSCGCKKHRRLTTVPCTYPAAKYKDVPSAGVAFREAVSECLASPGPTKTDRRLPSELLILTPDSGDRWLEFISKLSERLFVDIGIEGWRWPCSHNYRSATKIMNEMGGIDIPKSIAFFQDNGGCCDCEIVRFASTSMCQCIELRHRCV
jgi:hypothetical protein